VIGSLPWGDQKEKISSASLQHELRVPRKEEKKTLNSEAIEDCSPLIYRHIKGRGKPEA